MRRLRGLLAWLVVAALALAAAAAVWLRLPLDLVPNGRGAQGQPVVDLRIDRGLTASAAADAAVAAGVRTWPVLLQTWFRLSGQGARIQAGSYEIAPGTSPLALLDQLVRGEQALRRVTLLEGWTVRQALQALRTAPDLRFDLGADAGPALLAALGLDGRHPEGRFFPDTYVYPKGGRASDVLRQAAAAMDQRLAQAWTQRLPNLPLREPHEALILASIVEKETGAEPDRARIAGVFVNRLRIGMRLQTDPAVIYGLGPAFDGNLRRRDLQADTPYNTYTRAGLPPTPIALPGWASLLAAVRPEPTPALYFVARGDGRSEFSSTLAEHNRAVRRYILAR